LEWAHDVCKKLREAQHWADFIDPCSGRFRCLRLMFMH
jgi:hypothetical protein